MTVTVAAELNALQTGLEGVAGYAVYSVSGNVLRVARAAFPVGSEGPAGVYHTSFNADAAWFPIRIVYDDNNGVGGVGHVTSEVIYNPSAALGGGPVPVDHNGGPGVTVWDDTLGAYVASEPDILRYEYPGGGGAGGLTVAAYLASDWDADPPARTPVAQTITAADGRWASSLNLLSGTYYVVADAAGDGWTAKKTTIVVP